MTQLLRRVSNEKGEDMNEAIIGLIIIFAALIAIPVIYKDLSRC